MVLNKKYIRVMLDAYYIIITSRDLHPNYCYNLVYDIIVSQFVTQIY